MASYAENGEDVIAKPLPKAGKVTKPGT